MQRARRWGSVVLAFGFAAMAAACAPEVTLDADVGSSSGAPGWGGGDLGTGGAGGTGGATCALPFSDLGSSEVPCGAPAWLKQPSIPGHVTYASDSTTDAAGNVLVVGYANPVGKLTGELWIAKYDASGAEIFSRMFHYEPWATNSFLGHESISVDGSGNIAVCGRFSEKLTFSPEVVVESPSAAAFCAKLDPSGDPLWARRLSDFDAFEPSVGGQGRFDALGNLVVAGHLGADLDLGAGLLAHAGGGDVFVAKLDPDGNALWSARFGDEAAQRVDSVAIGPQGDIVFVGHFGGSLDFGDGPLVAGDEGSSAFVARLDPLGNVMWSRSRGGYASAVSIDAAGTIVVAGSEPIGAQSGGRLFALAASGDELWSREIAFESGSVRLSGAAAIGMSGRLGIAGSFHDPTDSVCSSGWFFSELDAAGEALCASFLYVGATPAAGLAPSNGGLTMTGNFQEPTTLWGTSLTSSGYFTDSFIARFGP